MNRFMNINPIASQIAKEFLRKLITYFNDSCTAQLINLQLV